MGGGDFWGQALAALAVVDITRVCFDEGPEGELQAELDTVWEGARAVDGRVEQPKLGVARLSRRCTERAP
jgi:hypothetical protein